MPPTLTLLRHPRPDAPDGLCYGRTDLEALALDEQRLFDELAATLTPQRLVSSPALRCRGIAERLGRHWQRTCEIEPRLQEIDFGRWEGLAWERVPRHELEAWARRPLDHEPGGGESLRRMERRLRAWAADAAALRMDLLAVTHAGPMRLLATLGRGAPLDAVLDTPAPGFGQALRLPLDRFGPPPLQDRR
ncbi:MAG: histidine phosphatase family protein [Burkholderiales bacterium]|nr:histidine phosphatase family protein [Burkholderiales bacterium]